MKARGNYHFIKPADKYLTFVIPAKAGMTDFDLLIAGLIMLVEGLREAAA